jgi:hypothetical protein
LLLGNKSKFVSLTRILTILSFVLLSAFGVKAQQSRDPFQESAQRIMKLYPNPAVSFIKFDFQQKYSSGYSLQIINFIGRQVYEMKNINPSSTLDLTPYNRGVYIYQLKDQYGKLVESGKFQVSK